MSFQPGANLYTQGFGSRPESVEVPHYDVRAPAATDVLYPIGKRWIWPGTGSWELNQISSVAGVTTATWLKLSDSDGPVQSVVGTANQVTVTSSSGTSTVSLPSAITTPGSLTTTTTLTATAGNITATNGNLVLGTAGNKIVSTSVGSGTSAGANSFGTVTLTGGTATVSTTSVTASSIIMLTRQSPGATGAAALGMLSVGTVTASTSFVINALASADSTALAATDVSVIGWMIIN